MTNQINKNLEPNFIYEQGQWVINWVPITPIRQRLFQQATSPPSNYQSSYKFKLIPNNYRKKKWIPKYQKTSK